MGFDPGWLAKVDQKRALTMENVARSVAFYREHVDEHDGDVVCAWSKLAGQILMDTGASPVLIVDLLAGAVERIAQLERELGR